MYVLLLSHAMKVVMKTHMHDRESVSSEAGRGRDAELGHWLCKFLPFSVSSSTRVIIHLIGLLHKIMHLN